MHILRPTGYRLWFQIAIGFIFVLLGLNSTAATEFVNAAIDTEDPLGWVIAFEICMLLIAWVIFYVLWKGHMKLDHLGITFPSSVIGKYANVRISWGEVGSVGIAKQMRQAGRGLPTHYERWFFIRLTDEASRELELPKEIRRHISLVPQQKKLLAILENYPVRIEDSLKVYASEEEVTKLAHIEHEEIFSSPFEKKRRYLLVPLGVLVAVGYWLVTAKTVDLKLIGYIVLVGGTILAAFYANMYALKKVRGIKRLFVSLLITIPIFVLFIILARLLLGPWS